MVVQYKCSNCGADMAFDATSGMLHCDSCGTYREIDPKTDTTKEEQRKKKSKDHIDKEPFTNEVREYSCNNCGAILITDQDTSATTCTFCNAPVILQERLSGTFAPAKVIPFTITKEQAMKAFRSWCHKGMLTPKGFMTADRVKSITGLYVPFWLYDLNSIGEVDATCTRVRKYTSGDYIYTETSYYKVHRKVNLNYLKVPADASAKLNDELMDKLEPFDYSQLKEFNMPYLAGYLAEKYNYDDNELLPRIKDRVKGYVDQYIRTTIVGYSSTIYNRKDIAISKTHADYVLLPVWIVCYDYKQTEYIFAMNGQTGKIVGKPPLSIKKMLAWFSGISAGAYILLSIISLFSGGV